MGRPFGLRRLSREHRRARGGDLLPGMRAAKPGYFGAAVTVAVHWAEPERQSVYTNVALTLTFLTAPSTLMSS